MLQTLRDKTSGWVATLILGLLMIPFVFVLDSRYLGGDSPDDLAQIQAPPPWWPTAPLIWPVSLLWQRQTISIQAFKQRFDQLRMEQRERLKDQFDTREFDRLDNQLRVVNQMIDERILNATAVKERMSVTPRAIYQTIANIPSFQTNGAFDKAVYASVLARMNPPRTPKIFEQMVRESLLTSSIPDVLLGSSFFTPFEAKRVLGLMGQTRSVQWIPLPVVQPSPNPVTNAQIAQWYQSHLTSFRQAEQVTIEYVLLSASLLPPPAPADDKILRQRYEAEKSRFFAPEERLVQHLLIAAGANPEQNRSAKAQAAQLAQQARQPGADFAALARRFSQDPGSKASGGQLGWIEKGSMPSSFDQALFALKPGEVSDPVQTSYGFHIIKVVDVRGGHGKAFEAVRDQLAQEYLRQESDKALNTRVGQFVDSVEQGGQGFVAAAKQVGAKIQQLGPFMSDQGTGIAADAHLRQVAFALAQSPEHPVSDPIKLGQDQTVFLRVINHTPPMQLPLEQVRDQVIAAISADGADQAERQIADRLLKRLQHGDPLSTIGKELGVAPKTITNIRRGSNEPSALANQAIFAVPPLRDKKPVFGMSRLDNGHYALFQLVAVTQGDLKNFSPDQLRMIEEQLAQMEGNRALEIYLAALRKQYKIAINQELLQ